MPVILPPELPARRALAGEGVEVLSPGEAKRLQLRPLRIALLNLMPTKAKTETQIARLLGGTPFQIELTLFVPDSYEPRTTPAGHMTAFYRRFSEIRAQHFDGLIVTGAPVETLPFEAVNYWDELGRILDWSRTNVRRSFYICWAAQAALQHFHGVPKHGLDEKLFGVFRHRVVKPDAEILRGFGDGFAVPVSRHTEVRAADLPAASGVEILAHSTEAGLCLLEEPARGAVYMFNHLEYDTHTLRDEYQRDLEAGKPIGLPRNYFPDDDDSRPPCNGWRSYGALLFRNWIDGIARAAASDSPDEPALSWLFPERPRPAAVGESASEFLVVGAEGPETLPAVLRALADLQLSPLAVKASPPGGRATAILLRLEAMDQRRSQAVAEALLRCPGVRRVACRQGEAAGGIYLPTERPLAKRAAAKPRWPGSNVLSLAIA